MASGSTDNYGLPLWEDNDHPGFTQDFNPAMRKIDETLKDVSNDVTNSNANAMTALTNSQNALETASTANTTADTALTVANTASTTANAASTKAEQALSAAENAESAATSAAASASSAQASATKAEDSASKAEVSAAKAEEFFNFVNFGGLSTVDTNVTNFQMQYAATSDYSVVKIYGQYNYTPTSNSDRFVVTGIPKDLLRRKSTLYVQSSVDQLGLSNGAFSTRARGGFSIAQDGELTLPKSTNTTFTSFACYMPPSIYILKDFGDTSADVLKVNDAVNLELTIEKIIETKIESIVEASIAKANK